MAQAAVKYAYLLHGSVPSSLSTTCVRDCQSSAQHSSQLQGLSSFGQLHGAGALKAASTALVGRMTAKDTMSGKACRRCSSSQGLDITRTAGARRPGAAAASTLLISVWAGPGAHGMLQRFVPTCCLLLGQRLPFRVIHFTPGSALSRAFQLVDLALVDCTSQHEVYV